LIFPTTFFSDISQCRNNWGICDQKCILVVM